MTSDIDVCVIGAVVHFIGADAFFVPPIINLGTDHVAVTYIYASMVRIDCQACQLIRR